MASGVADPAQVRTRDEFGTALRERLGRRSVRALEDALDRQHTADRGALATGLLEHPLGETAGKTTISEVFNGARLPTQELLCSLLRLVDASDEEYRRWLAAWRRAEDSPRPGLRLQVGEADPRLLGVHKAIQVGAAPGELPEYVERDVDIAACGVRAELGKAAQRGGFVLLVGDSSVGKSRCAYQAITALMPDWQILHPDPGSDQLARLAANPIPKTVVWLDELQRYLGGPGGLTADTVRDLIAGSGPIVLVGTLWPGRYAIYTAPPRDGAHEDPYRWEREVLDLAEVVTIDTDWSDAELSRAQEAADRDPRVKQAVCLAGGRLSLPQILAAAPQLEQRWHYANPYAAALLAAAVDASRLGFRSPLPAEMLRAAAPGYCDSLSRAAAPPNWFETAIAYATEPLHGAASALEPVAGAGMGEILGYCVADYLLQYATPLRHRKPVPASLWDAFPSHAHDPGDARRLAANATQRLFLNHAVALLVRTAPSGGGKFNLPPRIAALLAERDDANINVEVVRARARHADHGPHAARNRLAGLLARRGDDTAAVELLRPLADSGDRSAAQQLAGLLARRGDDTAAVELLRPHADSGDRSAAQQLAGLLARRGDDTAAVELLRPHADSGDRSAAQQLAGLLARRGDIHALATRTAAGDPHAARKLALLLIRRGDSATAVEALLSLVDTGDGSAGQQLAGTLARRGDIEVLATLTNAGDRHAANRLAELMRHRGDTNAAIEVLLPLVDTGDGSAAQQLAGLLTRRGEIAAAIDVLQPFAEAGDGPASQQIAGLLARCGDIDALATRADGGDRHAAKRLALLLARDGDINALAIRADGGDPYAGRKLVSLLARRGDASALRSRADAGDRLAARRFAELIANQGDTDAAIELLRPLADLGDHDAAARLTNLLAERGDVDALLSEVLVGNSEHAAEAWLRLLERSEMSADQARAREIRRDGLSPPAFA